MESNIIVRREAAPFVISSIEQSGGLVPVKVDGYSIQMTIGLDYLTILQAARHYFEETALISVVQIRVTGDTAIMNGEYKVEYFTQRDRFKHSLLECMSEETTVELKQITDNIVAVVISYEDVFKLYLHILCDDNAKITEVDFEKAEEEVLEKFANKNDNE